MAAVALPQYTKAVEKSRTAEAMTALGDMATAEQLYYMAQNTFTEDLGLLDISFADPYVGTAAKGTVPTTATAKNCIETSSYYICLKTSGNNITGIATRKTGTYASDTLDIKVEPSGKVTKSCEVKAKGLDKLATTWC